MERAQGVYKGLRAPYFIFDEDKMDTERAEEGRIICVSDIKTTKNNPTMGKTITKEICRDISLQNKDPKVWKETKTSFRGGSEYCEENT